MKPFRYDWKDLYSEKQYHLSACISRLLKCCGDFNEKAGLFDGRICSYRDLQRIENNPFKSELRIDLQLSG